MARKTIVVAFLFLLPLGSPESAAGPFETGVAERDDATGPAAGGSADLRRREAGGRDHNRSSGMEPPQTGIAGRVSGSGAPDEVDVDAAARLDYSSSRGGAE